MLVQNPKEPQKNTRESANRTARVPIALTLLKRIISEDLLWFMWSTAAKEFEVTPNLGDLRVAI